jgi:predicted secreted protein
MEHSRIFLLITIVLLLFACLALDGREARGAMVITKDDNGKEITMPEGEIFEVRLQQHGGTGYLWQIVDPGETHLKVLESTEIPLKQEGIVGGPLVKTWKIKAVKTGKANLKILLYRPWEGPGKAAGSFGVKIRIR